jgi:hypothetical protein
MITEQDQRWYQLYRNNSEIYPVDDDDLYGDGLVLASNFSEAFINIALAVANPDALTEADVHIWQINEERFGFKLNENIQIVREEYW